jgi:hypothetical protein
MKAVRHASRAPGGLADRSDGRSRWRKFALAVLLLALLLLLALCHGEPDIDGLAESHLVGSRTPTPIDFVVMIDESGSFNQYDQVRRQVLDQLTSWAPENLRASDTLTVIGFSSEAYVKLATIPVGGLGSGTPRYITAQPGDSTSIQPAIEVARDKIDGSRPRSLVVVTDTVIDDADKSEITRAMAGLRVTSMSVIVPSGASVLDQWSDAFPYEAEFRAKTDSASETAVAVGRAIAHATDQKLEVER